MISETLLVVLILSLFAVGFTLLFFSIKAVYRKFFLPKIVKDVKKEMNRS